MAVKRPNGPVGTLIGIGEEVPMLDLKRRQFIALVGGGGLLLAAKVRRARGQQPAMPVVGLCHQSIAIMGLPSRELFADDAMPLLTGRAETPP
jgi:hypothetical protein